MQADREHDKNGHAFTSAEVDLKVIDRVLSCLLILGGIGHTAGSVRFYKSDPMTLLWALCASLFVFMLGVLSFIRAGRPGDTTLAWVCLVFGIGWIAASVRFAALIGNYFDFRPLIFVLPTLGLCAMCVRTLILKR